MDCLTGQRGSTTKRRPEQVRPTPSSLFVRRANTRKNTSPPASVFPMESTRERYKIERAVFRSEGWERVVTPCDGGHNRPLCHQGCCWACGEESALRPRPRYRLLRAFAKKKQGPFFVVAMSQTKKIGAGGGSVKPSLFARHIHALHKGMVCVFFSLSPRVHYTMLTEPRA